jgi:hypothetical protein
MNGHAEELAKAIGYLKQDEILQNLIKLDPDNREIYEAELTDRSE